MKLQRESSLKKYNVCEVREYLGIKSQIRWMYIYHGIIVL